MYPGPFNFADVKKEAHADEAGQARGLLTSPSPCSDAPCARRFAVMAGVTERLEVVGIEARASVLDLDDMIDKIGRRCAALFQALFAEWMGAAVHRSQPAPFGRLIEIVTERARSVVFLLDLFLFGTEKILAGSSGHVPGLSECSICRFSYIQAAFMKASRHNAPRTRQVEILRAFKGKIPEIAKQGSSRPFSAGSSFY